jgi:hypothetical protein
MVHLSLRDSGGDTGQLGRRRTKRGNSALSRRGGSRIKRPECGNEQVCAQPDRAILARHNLKRHPDPDCLHFAATIGPGISFN